MGTIDEILSDDVTQPEPVAEVTAPEPEPQPEPEPEGAVRDEKGRFAPKAKEDPAGRLPQDVYEPLKAVRGENQQLKSQLETLQQQLQQLQNPPAPPPSVFEDEEGAFQHFGGRVVTTAVSQASQRARLDTSEMLAAQAFPDFEEVWEPMNQFLTENPAVAQKAFSDRHPWSYAYKAYKNASTLQELGATDMASLEAKLREKIMAEMQAQPASPPQPNLPPTLSNERNVGSRSGPAWAGPKPLAELLG